MTGNEPTTLAWSVRPAQDSPQKLVVVVVAAMVAAGFGFLISGSPVLALAGLGIVAGATAEFWLGTSYRLTEKEASARCGLSLTAIAWADVRRVEIDGNRVKLSPLASATRMDAFRGVVLGGTADNGAEIRAFVRRNLPDGVAVEWPSEE
jgi:hypothetical protein